MAKSNDYVLTTWMDDFGKWNARAEFTYPGLGNTGEAERVLFNARRGAHWAIKNQVALRAADPAPKWVLRLEAVKTEHEMGVGRLLAITWAEK